MAELVQGQPNQPQNQIDEAKRQKLLELVRGRALARPTDLADDEVMVWPSLVVVEAVLQLSQHILHGLSDHRGPFLLVANFAGAGLVRPEVTALDIPTPFASFEDYWQPFLGGQGPAPAYAMALDENARTRLRDRIRARVPAQADGSISLTARAWAVRASVAK